MGVLDFDNLSIRNAPRARYWLEVLSADEVNVLLAAKLDTSGFAAAYESAAESVTHLIEALTARIAVLEATYVLTTDARLSDTRLPTVVGDYPVTAIYTRIETYDFPNIPAASASSFDVSVPGAEDGDLVTVTPTASGYAGGQIIYSGRVSAPDTVQVTAVNVSAGDIDPDSAVFKIMVIKF